MPTLGTKRTMQRETMSRKLARLEKDVRRNKAELKFITIDSTSYGEMTTSIVQGTDKDERIGDTINVKKIEVRVNFTEGSDNRRRLVLYTPNDPTGDILSPADYQILSTGQRFVQFIDEEQFRVWDEKLDMGQLTDATATDPLRHLTLTKTFGIPMKVRYDGATGRANHNPLKWLLATESNTGTLVDTATDQVSMKVWYYDG